MGATVDDILGQLNTQISIFQREERRNDLIHIVNHLLLHDFNALLQILYRVDVDEQKLKAVLRQNPGTDAAVLIADLLIARQEEKGKGKEKEKEKESSKDDDTIAEGEKW